MNEFLSLVELLRWRATHQPARRAYTFVADEEGQGEVSLTYAELDGQARAIAARLQSLGAKGERVLLLYPPGLEYVAAFFGCLYAGAIAVPAYPPRPNRPDPRLQAILADAQATLALTTEEILSHLRQRAADHTDQPALRWLTHDSLISGRAEEWREPKLCHTELAFLQYTSGSTAAPKGVMVSHGSLLCNLAVVYQRFELDGDSRSVTWLPPYHDMGLIGGILEPLYGGFPVLLMSPVTFLRHPLRWLRAISHTKATTSGGPNFAYDLCVQKSTPEQRASPDLSSWKVAYNGAEPIHPGTLERFAAAFEPCGFRRDAFYPCYGLAEATLMVTGGSATQPPAVHWFRRASLERGHVEEVAADEAAAQCLVGCGRPLPPHQLVIVDPETQKQCAAHRIVIWISGPSVARGYWNRSEETDGTFHAHLTDTGHGPFLRTGDLGFLKDDELFVTGRIKDLIIVRGRNHYPQDIERTVEQSHPALRLASNAAFTVEEAGEQRLVIIQEVRHLLKEQAVDQMVGAVREAVARYHDLQVHTVVLVRAASIAKTSSGKIQRRACRNAFLAGALNTVAIAGLGDRAVLR